MLLRLAINYPVIGYRILYGKTLSPYLCVLIYLFIGIITSSQLDARRVVTRQRLAALESLTINIIFQIQLPTSGRFVKHEQWDPVAYLGEGLCEGPPWPDRRDFCNYFGIIFSTV